MSKPTTPPIERALARLTVAASGCWEYPTLNESGYGVIGAGPRGGKTIRVHRLVFEYVNGPIPDGLHLDHLCRNRACANPDHLEPVTAGENVRRGERKGNQAQCAQGHKFTPENTRTTPRQRVCRECEKQRGIEYRARKRGNAA